MAGAVPGDVFVKMGITAPLTQYFIGTILCSKMKY